MTETKGLIMKITDSYMVVMCDDGKFRNLPVPEPVPAIGERIEVPLSQQKKRFPIYWLSAAAVFFIAFLGSVLWLQFQTKVYQVVAIDINPSLELYLDSENRVIKAKHFNKDAENLLNRLPSEKLALNDAIPQIIKKSIALGYIKKDTKNLIMISFVKLREGASEISPGSLKNLVAETMQTENMNGYLKINVANGPLYKESKKKDISLNVLILVHQTKKQGFYLKFDKTFSRSVESIMYEAGIKLEQFFIPVGPASKGSVLPVLREQNGETTVYNNPSNRPFKEPQQEVQTEESKLKPNYSKKPTQQPSENTSPGNPSGTSAPPISDPTTSTPPTSDPTTSTPPTSDPTTSTPPTSDPTTSTPPTSDPTTSTPTTLALPTSGGQNSRSQL